MGVFVPSFVSEFPDASRVTDCVPASNLMLVNKITHNKYPASIAEREALQNAMGTQDVGADANDAVKGVKARYGITLGITSGWPAVAGALTDPMKGITAIGSYPKLPEYVRNQGNQPSFNGLHDIYMQGDGVGTVLVGDPLASRFYLHVAPSDLRAYVESFPNAVIIAREQPPTLVGFRLLVGPGWVTFYKVMRFTHTLYGARRVYWDHVSSAPVWHGAPGFWHIYAGGLTGYYAVYGHTPTMKILAIYSDGSSKPVAANT